MPSVGKPLPHDSATGHVTGSAQYIDDLPRREDELFVNFVGAPIAAGRARSIDLAAARHALSSVAEGQRVELAIPATGEELLMRMTALASQVKLSSSK